MRQAVGGKHTLKLAPYTKSMFETYRAGVSASLHQFGEGDLCGDGIYLNRHGELVQGRHVLFCGRLFLRVHSEKEMEKV